MLHKEIIFQACHRGSKEMDLILGPFVRDKITTYSEKQIKTTKNFLSQDDNDIHDWLWQHKNVPEHFAFIVNDLQAYLRLDAA